MRKPRTDSAFADLSPENADSLFAACQSMSYGRALAFGREEFGLDASRSALARWWQRESKRRLRERVRHSISASTSWDVKVDEAKLDARMSKALKEGFFEFMSVDDPKAALQFAGLALAGNKGRIDAAKAMRRLAAEKRADKAEEAIAQLTAKVRELEAALTDAGKPGSVDTAAVMAEVDRLLGRGGKA